MRKTKAGHKWGNRWHPEKSKFPKEKARKLYMQGLSYRQIAAVIGWSDAQVAKACKDIARSQRDAAILRQPPTAKTWRACRAQARKIMERHIGRKLESWEHVHHKDEDYTNNSLDNLEIRTATEHAKLHHPKNPVPRNQRPDRIAWTRKWNAEVRKVMSRCAWCKKKCKVDKYKLAEGKPQHCSHRCASKSFWEKRKSANKKS